MAKKDDVQAIKEANGVSLNEEDFSAAELATLRKLAEGGEDSRAEFSAKVQEFKKPAEKAESSDADDSNKISVRVNPAKGSGSYLHPSDKVMIRRGAAEAVKVSDDAWTQDMLAKRFLTEVRK